MIKMKYFFWFTKKSLQTKFQNESNRFDNNPCKQNSEVNLSSIGQFLSRENYEEIMNSLPNQN